MTALTRPTPGTLPRRVLTVAALLVAMTLVAAAGAYADDATYEVEFPGDRPVEGEHDHVVESGEYLSSIASDYGLTAEGWHVIYDANEHIADPNLVHVGD